MILSFDEYTGNTNKDNTKSKPIIKFDDYVGINVPKIVSPEQYNQGITKPKLEERSFIAKHPNLYGTFGAAQSLIPYIKYIDPADRERFAKLSTQKQTRELLLQNLETVAMIGTPAIAEGITPLIAKFLPKTYKALQFVKTPIKEMGELYQTPAKEIAGKTLAQGQKLTAHKIAVYKNTTGEHPPAKLIKQWWADSVKAITPKIAPVPSTGTKDIQATTPVLTDPVQKITQAIKEAKPIRGKQETLYSEERSKRLKQVMAVGEQIPGEKGYIVQLGKLKGKLPKVEFESIRNKVGQEDVDALFDIVNKSAEVTGFQNITAKAGLAKLLGAQGGTVPTRGELELLRKIFPEDFTKTLLKKRSLWEKTKEAGGQIFNLPRSIMSSFDLSAPFRQGLFLIGKPKQFFGAFAKMFRLFSSETAYQALQKSITQKPTYNLMQESGLSLAELGSNMLMREERFMSQWAEKIPVVGQGVRASSRAYVGFLNKLRADVFDDLVRKADKLGLDPKNNIDLTKRIAKFINAATGRGGLGGLEGAAVGLNSFFFSPRLMASRLTLLNPIYYIKQDPFVRKEALKSLFTLSGGISTVLGLAKAGGAEVGLDWRSADFAKIKIGNTRIDIMGGFQQYIRAAGQLISGEYVSTTTKKVMTLGEGYKPLTRLDILYKQIETKEAPVFSFITQLLKGQDIQGKKIDVPKEIGKRFIPMVMGDIYDITKDDPELLPVTVLGVFGVGLQTYKPKLSRQGGIKGIKGITTPTR